MNKKRKLKIAIFHLAFIYSGGGERLVLEEARGLKELGHDIEIFAPVVNRKNCFPDIIAEFDIRTFLPHLPFIVPGHESFQILLTCALAPLFSWRFRNFDVILAANQPSPWIAWWVKFFFKVPYVSYLAQPTRILYPREIDKKTGLVFSKRDAVSYSAKLLRRFGLLVHFADRVSVEGSDAVLANGEYMKGVLEKIYKIKAITCAAGAYPSKRIKNYELRVRGKINIGKKVIRKPYLLITNRHFAQKRFEHGIFALSSILDKYPDYSLIITGGETEYTDEVKVLINRLNLNGKVVFTGYVKDGDLKKLYENCAAYLYTAPEEDFGMGIIEAMAQGVPVVAWDAAGPSKIIKDGRTGLLAVPYKVADFADKISRILTERKFAEQIGRQAREDIRNNFSYKNHLEILEKTLHL